MIRFTKIGDVRSPERGTALSAGIDFFVPNDFPVTRVLPQDDVLIPSHIKVEIPEHCALLSVDKSGISSSSEAKERRGMTEKNKGYPSSVVIGAKLIDADYPGEIHIHLINVGNKPIVIKPGDKVAQFILIPVFTDNWVEVPENELRIPSTERVGGFGSTTK